MKTTFKSILIENTTTEFLSDEKKITEWLDSIGVKNYSINQDMSVTVNGNLLLDDKNLTEIPVKFKEVHGGIDVTSNKIKRLDWCPSIVKGSLEAWDNEIETLVGGPIEIEGSFDIDNNKLTNLQGAPKKVGGAFIITSNKLSSLVGCPEIVGEYFKASICGITHLDDLPRSIGTNVYLQNNNISNLKGIGKLIKSINTKNSSKGGRIVLSANPIETGLSGILNINGVKNIEYQPSASDTKAQKIAAALKIINDGLKDGNDVMDIQDKLIDSEFASLA